MKRRIAIEYKLRLSEKIMDWANLSFVGLVITQFVPLVKINWVIASFGTILLIAAYLAAYKIVKGGGK